MQEETCRNPNYYEDLIGGRVDTMVRRAALEAAIRWMEYYGKPIKDNYEYGKMMRDDTIEQNYKDDITLIRAELNKKRV